MELKRHHLAKVLKRIKQKNLNLNLKKKKDRLPLSEVCDRTKRKRASGMM
jgi:hypothetical protein